MIEAVVTALLRILATQAVAEFSLLWGLEAEIQKLKGDLEVIKAVLEEAEEREHKEDKPVQTLLRDLRDMAYDAVDVFDELNMEAALHPELLTERDAGVIIRSVTLVSACFLSCFTDTPNPLLFRHLMASRVRKIMADLNEIKERKKGLLGFRVEGNCPESSNTRHTSSFPDIDQPLLGRDAHKQQLIEVLCAPDDCVPRLVPIVGMGGIGKTTLAQAVYNDGIVEAQFPLRKWVFVGEKFDARKIIEQVLPQASRKEFGKNPTLDDLHRCLINEIKDKRFLIVLDDVWSEEIQEWNQLWRPLAYGFKGGKVLVTTRSQKVGTMKKPIDFTLALEPLSEIDCRTIFEKCAFGERESDQYPDLKKIGMKIVEKLKGSPLAARLIGGALYNDLSETYWGRLLNSDIWLQNLEEEGVLPSLLLSYHALSSHLKPCFQFCSLFPKDHRFRRQTLVRMWMAHDFIQPVGGERMEDVGSRYFDELLQRSFFQYINESYVMHDLIHDLAQFISKGECLRIEDKKQSCNEPESIRHLSLCCEGDELEPRDLYQFNGARTLLDVTGSFIVKSDRIFCQLLGRLKCMRVLDLSRCYRLRSLPKCISDLKHLRYLDLCYTGIQKLPESLCTLYNLQTLRVNGRCRPPKGMSKLVNLRHLEANENYISEIVGVGKLTCLQELKGPFKVSEKEGHRMGELEGMNQLRGTLRVENLEKVTSTEEAAGIKLKDKVLLDRLELIWGWSSECEHSMEQVMEALQPPRELKELMVESYPGTQPPSWMRQDAPSLSNMVTLELHDCRNWKCLPTGLGRLPRLTTLKIEGSGGVKKVGPEFHCYDSGGDVVAFPSLEELQFGDMYGWERWVDGSGAEEEEETEYGNRVLGGGNDQRHPHHKHPKRCYCFPRLRKLHFRKCPKLTTLSGLLRHHQLDALEDVLISYCTELGRLLGGGGEEGKLPLHWARKRMLKFLEIAGCPKLAWSEVEPLVLHAASSLRALRIYLNDGDFRWPLKLNELVQEASPAKESTALEFVGTNARELLTWLLHPGRRSLESLTSLRIENCEELTGFTEEEEEDDWRRNLPSLRELTFRECPNLRSLPAELQQFSSLQNLFVDYCPQVLALPERGLPSTLQILTIRSCSVLHGSLAVPPSLRTLQIWGCPLLEDVTWSVMELNLMGSSSSHSPSSSSSSSSFMTPPVRLEDFHTNNRRLLSWLLRQPRRLDALRQLYFCHCTELETFTEEEKKGWRLNLPSLQELHIWSCPNLQSLPVPPNLLTLHTWGCPLLKEFMWLEVEPHQIGSSSSPSAAASSSSTAPVRLERLQTDSRWLVSWLLLQPRRLHSLRRLEIYECEELEAFTGEEIEGWHRNLPSLERLKICHCPNLLFLPEGLHIDTEIHFCPKLQAPPSRSHRGRGFPCLSRRH